MRAALVGVLLLTAATASATPARRACCDLWIFEPAGGRAESYAVEVRASREVVVAEMSLDHAPRLLQGQAARAKLREWTAASHKPGADSILVQGPDAEIHLDPLGPLNPIGAIDDDKDERDEDEGDNLVIVVKMTPAKARAFVNEIDNLPPEMNATMKAIIPDR